MDTVQIQFDHYYTYNKKQRVGAYKDTAPNVQHMQMLPNLEPDPNDQFDSSIALNNGILTVVVLHNDVDSTSDACSVPV